MKDRLMTARYDGTKEKGPERSKKINLKRGDWRKDSKSTRSKK